MAPFDPCGHGRQPAWSVTFGTVPRPAMLFRVVPASPTFAAGIGQFAVIQAVAPSVGVEVSPIDLSEQNQIEGAIATLLT